MFTVLIAEKEHIEAIQQKNKLFFEPFLENKELAFCRWDPMGQSLHDSVPDLLDAVGRRKSWRAVIINKSTADNVKLQNPFDVVDYSAVESLELPKNQPESDAHWGEWEKSWKDYYDSLSSEKEAVYKNALENPLQKLTTWLCFKPTDYVLNDVQEKQDVHDWAMEQIGRDDLKPSVRLEIMERDQYKKELRMKECIRRDFVADKYMNITYPAEVHCISIRTAETSFFDPDSYWNVRQDSEYSTFADRNMYFDMMRFVVFDLLPETHRNFRNDYIRFLASVLIFISNPVPSSAMQARYLYTLDVDTDDTPLCTLVTSYDKKLSATAEVIETEMEKIRSEIPGAMTDKAAEALFCTSKDVAVLLDESCNPDKVLVEKDYGLFFDAPENELYKWNRAKGVSEKELTYIVKQQARSVRKSVGQMHLSSDVVDANISRLTSFQIDDVREYTNSAEDDMIDSIPKDLSDMSEYTELMENEAENVENVIRRRMTKKTTVILSVICLGLYLACFMPFLFSNTGTSKTVTTAVILSICMLIVLAGVLLVTLFVLRSKVLRAIKNYNNTMRDIINDIQASMKQFSRYLTNSCNVRRGHAVQNYAKKNVDEYTKSLRIRKKHQEDIRKRRAYLEEDYGDYLGDKSFCDETMSRAYEYDFDEQKEFAYPAPFLAGDCRQIEFISNGNFITVPSSFVTKMLVRKEGIYEK